MSLLAALNLDLEISMLPVSTLHWRADLLKIPAHGNHYEQLPVHMEDGVNFHGLKEDAWQAKDSQIG
ncbi:unnamed protein product [Ranitomeya imitator]|uniref:Uncharacterized protein n=1 Tax=Ranitomeya imitator TaxID=111125 RepID=A0ABN9LWR0_9NEOB|nr:unnamed protein product [Ranitomeya imitator]